jgi:ribosome-associated protein
MTAPVHPVAITGASIRLGQLLKLAGVVDHGGEAKALLAQRPVLVNGAPETRRGRQLRAGDTVAIGDTVLAVVAAGTPGPTSA